VVAGQRWLKCGAIRDFCPYRVRAAGTSNLGLRSSTLVAGSVFACDVESALPYSETSLAKDDGTFADDAMIDKERVVFLTGVSHSSQTLSYPAMT
jgi:hypothetical protein